MILTRSPPPDPALTASVSSGRLISPPGARARQIRTRTVSSGPCNGEPSSDSSEPGLSARISQPGVAARAGKYEARAKPVPHGSRGMGRTGALLRKKHEAPHPRDVALNSNRDATKPNWRGGDGLFLDRSVCFRIVINKLGTDWGSEIPPDPTLTLIITTMAPF